MEVDWQRGWVTRRVGGGVGGGGGADGDTGRGGAGGGAYWGLQGWRGRLPPDLALNVHVGAGRQKPPDFHLVVALGRFQQRLAGLPPPRPALTHRFDEGRGGKLGGGWGLRESEESR